MELGGPVLTIIAFVIFLMWVLIIERLLFAKLRYPKLKGSVLSAWNQRKEKKSWYAHQIREQLISVASLELQNNLLLIKALVALCPLLGLLGTVTGMVEVFEVMAISGSGNVRSMAAGVSKATVPTMAGMVAALSGVFMSVYLQRQAVVEREMLSEKMTLED